MSDARAGFLQKYKGIEGVVILDDVLQKLDDPVAEIKKQTAGQLVVVVPFEYAWGANLNPLKNPLHKRNYDADLLAEHLTEGGYPTFILRTFNSGGWVFLAAEATKA